MRRLGLWAIAGCVLGLGTIAAGQTKISTQEDYAKVMKATAQAFGAANKAVGSGAVADAKPQIATLRENLTAVQAFWVGRKKDDGVAMAKDSLAKVAALEKALSGTDQAAAQAAAKELGGTCAACHKAYREGDAQTGYRFKAGVL
jgi:cytochrome c556